MFWAIATGLAVAVAALIALALLRPRAVSDAAAADLRIYQDQLDEVDRDLTRGTLAPEEAERVRLEVSRRLLEADRVASAARGPARAPAGVSRTVAGVSGVFVVGGALAIYATIGAPGYPDLPLQTRIEMSAEARRMRPDQAAAETSARSFTERARAAAEEAADPEFLALMERLRTTLEERPDEVEGLRLLARNEAGLSRFAEAAEAQKRVIALSEGAVGPEAYTDLAEYLIYAAGGYVSPEAEAALTAALQRDNGFARARYYTGLLYAQTGRPDMAFRLWRELLETGPADAPWVAPIRAQIEDVATLAGVRYTLPARRGPSPEDLAAAEDMSPEERQAMIQSMVSGLSQRLATEGGPVEDWARLIVALSVIGEGARATAILSEAREVFAGETDALALLEQAGTRAGLDQ